MARDWKLVRMGWDGFAIVCGSIDMISPGA